MESAVCFHQQQLSSEHRSISAAAVLGKELRVTQCSEMRLFHRLSPAPWLWVRPLSCCSHWSVQYTHRSRAPGSNYSPADFSSTGQSWMKLHHTVLLTEPQGQR